MEGLEWEVLVVDNNSTDETPEAVRELAKASPLNIRYVREGQQGLNFARNRGVVESRGKYFGFLDDDIAAVEGWLSALYGTLAREDADAVGGRIHLDAEVQLPPWINEEMYGFLGYQDLGEKVQALDGRHRYPFGGNMAFNRRVVDWIGLFNTQLGRRGEGRKRKELFKGAETEYFHRLAEHGARIFYEPSAVVYHLVLPFQLRKSYFRTIHYNAGYQKALNDASTYGRTVMGVPLFLIPQLNRSVIRYLAEVASKGPSYAFRQQMTVGHFLGMVRGYMARRRIDDLVDSSG